MKGRKETKTAVLVCGLFGGLRRFLIKIVTNNICAKAQSYTLVKLELGQVKLLTADFSVPATY